MEFGWAPEERDYRRDLRKFVEAEVPKEWIENPRQRPVVTPDDRTRTLNFNHKLASRGWLTSHGHGNMAAARPALGSISSRARNSGRSESPEAPNI